MRSAAKASLVALLLLPLGTPLAGQDCQALLKSFLLPDPRLSSIYVSMVTLNTKDVASYAEMRLYYVPAARIPDGPLRPGRYTWLAAGSQGVDQPKFDFGSRVQVFSDRLTADGTLIGDHVGLPHHGRQKFDEGQADDLGLEMTDTNPVRVTLRLRSWGDAKVMFTPRCEPGGFIYGSTETEKYVLRVSRWGEQR